MSRFDVKAFWEKHRNLIWGILGFLLIINFCNRQAAPPIRERTAQMEQKQEPVSAFQNGKSLESYEQIMSQRAQQQENRPSPFIITIILLAVGTFLVWQYQTRWKDKWFPGKVRFKAVRWRQKSSGRSLMRLMISNETKDSQTFMPPRIVFSRRGAQRQFQLKGGNGDEMFPLTLTPGTGHNVVIDLDLFFEKMPELKTFNRVGGSVSTSGGESYRCFTAPWWVVF